VIQPILLAETAEWFVINKPAGWLTIPAQTDTKTSVLRTWVEQRLGPAWVVHRLDRETSGVILFARTAEAHRKANDWFSNRKIRKKYHSFCSGKLSLPTEKIQTPVRGTAAITQVSVLESNAAHFLAESRPLTGRRHQIRIHLASLGTPIWGDTTYGGLSRVEFGGKALSVDRVALHARQLELPEGQRFEAPYPDDFSCWIDFFRSIKGA